MAAKKTRVKNYPPNDNSRSAATQKKEQCQWCKTKSPLNDQFTVVNDLDANDGDGAVVKQKVGKRKLVAKQSHWCGECAEKRVKMSERWLARRAAAKGGSALKVKPAKKAAPAKKKSAAKKSAPAAKPAAKKRAVKKPAAKVAPKAAVVKDDAPF